MAKLGTLTKKVASSVGSATKTVGKAAGGAVMSVGRSAKAVVGGVTGGISRGVGSVYKGAKRATVQALDLDALRPSNIFNATLDSAGLGILSPMFSGKGDSGRAKAAARVAEANKLPAKSGSISTATMESLLRGLLDINRQILENTNVLINYAKNTNNTLEEGNDLTKKKMLSDIENTRENKKASPATANNNKADATKPQGKGIIGGILGVVSSTISGIVSIFTSIVGLLSSIIGFATTLLGIVGKIALLIGGGLIKTFTTLLGLLGPVLGFATALVNLFTGIVGMIGGISGALINAATKVLPLVGGFLSSIFGFFARAGALLLANPIALGIGLAIAGIGALIYFFKDDIVDGIKSMTKKLSEWWENFHPVDAIIDFFSNIKDWIVEKFTNAVGFFSDWWQNFHPIDSAIELYTSIKNWIVDKFSDATKAFSDWWENFQPIDYVLNFFTKVKDWVVTKFTEATDAFTQWWDSFSIIDVVLTPFNYIKDKASSLFDDLMKNVSDILSFDLVGKIGNSISSLISSVWGFFKALPGKAMDLVGSFIPDSIKSLWNSFFGSNTPQLNAQSNVTPTLSGRDMTFNQQSARMATEQAGAPVVIVNNNNMNSAPPAAQNSIPRSSGTVSTSPQQSHIDRALYGNHYGMGLP